MRILQGITWDHVRGIAPLIATSKEFRQANPDITISWDKHSLKNFEDYPVEVLAKKYDLIMLDHPSMGANVEKKVIIPLSEWMPSSFLDEQKLNSVGPSFQSYTWAEQQWALPVDASAQVSAYRADLLDQLGLAVPQTWKEASQLIEQLPDPFKIGIPLHPTHAYCSFLTIYTNLVGTNQIDQLDHEVVLEVLARLAFFSEHTPSQIRFANPIQVLNLMSTTNEIVYVPIVFGYCNYAQSNFRPHVIHFTNIPTEHMEPIGGVLGGVGLAISAHSQQIEAAIRYAMFVVSERSQRGTYFASGGQPGHLQAWEDRRLNQMTNRFFTNTISTMKGASIRPRANGSIRLQEEIGQVIYAFLNKQLSQRDTAKKICQQVIPFHRG